MIETVWRDLRLAARSLTRAKAVSTAAIATLAIGIGATTVTFSVVNGVLLKPLPYPESERLIEIGFAASGLGTDDLPSAPFLHFTYQDHAASFEASGLWDAQPATVTGLAEPERVDAVSVTAEVLPLLGIEPELGRWFGAPDDEPRAARTTILSHGYWQRRFGGDPTVLEQSLTIDGEPHQIVGVMPRGFRFLDTQGDLFRTFRFDRAEVMLGLFAYTGIARLAPEASIETASAELGPLIDRAIDSYPPFPGSSREQFRAGGFSPKLKPLKQSIVGDVAGTLWVLMGTIGAVLLIACANVANLFLIRTEGRSRELAVRAALGAGRGRLVRTVLVESLVLGVLGGLLGLVVAYVGLEFVLTRGPSDLPRLEDIQIDAVVLAFVATVTPLTGLLFGTLPSLRFARPSLSASLGAAGRAANITREGQRTRGALVVAQVALALVLMIVATLMLRSFAALANVDPGFRGAEEVQTVRIAIPEQQVPDGEQAARMMQEIAERIAAVPGVEAVGFGSSAPLENYRTLNPVFIEGVSYSEDRFPPTRRLKFISPNFFASLGVPLLAGRDITWTDLYERRPVAIVSSAFATEEWGSPQAALGRHLRVNAGDPWREVVAVAGDVHDDGLEQAPPATAYFPALLEDFWGFPSLFWRPATYVIRTPRAGTQALMNELEDAVWSVNPNLPTAEAQTLQRLYDGSLARTSFTLVLLGAAGAMALLLSLVGLYGVIAYAVSLRSREIGIRLALGALPGRVQALFTRQALKLVAAGLGLGLLAAAGLTRLLQSILYGVAAFDPATFVAVPALMLIVGAVASLIPSRRALRVAPMAALRDD